ncbi:MAG: chromosome partitioning protein ParB, chromosome partitioning protein, ParB family [Chloroflexi bacterium CSP1-4]|nr:MAG: chromosome partitioning protein ParB, chromosome partitioning protein, ParB family [Chloroflexi bacterium CSP1-4]
MSVTDRRPGGGLGRGLASLIPQRATPPGPVEIAIARVQRNPYQPRQGSDGADLQALADSIAAHGVLQPILVTSTIDGYQLIAGERRLRAAEMAGLERIPAVVREAGDQAQLELALIENLQRADLSPLEEAHAFRQLMDEFGLDQGAVAQRVGKARSSVANTVRLLDLAEPVRAALADGRISEGHARAIAGLPEPNGQTALLATVVARGLNVRQAEELARRLKEPASTPARKARSSDPDLERLEADLRTSLGTKVTVTSGRRGGRITIEYYGNDDLERLYERLVGRDA